MISINQVYQTVLFYLAPEKRGELPPKVFNQYAKAAFTQIVENYYSFYGKSELNYGVQQQGYSNLPNNIFEKLRHFQVSETITGAGATINLDALSSGEFSRLGNIFLNNRLAVRKNHSALSTDFVSDFTKPTISEPAYIRTGNMVNLYPASAPNAVISGFTNASFNGTYVVQENFSESFNDFDADRTENTPKAGSVVYKNGNYYLWNREDSTTTEGGWTLSRLNAADGVWAQFATVGSATPQQDDIFAGGGQWTLAQASTAAQNLSASTFTASTDTVTVSQASRDNVLIEYLRRPLKSPNWAGSIDSNGIQPAYTGEELSDTATDFVNFDLHHSELNSLIAKISSLAGVTLRAADVIQQSEMEQQKQAALKI